MVSCNMIEPTFDEKDYYYSGNDLGVSCNQNQTIFKIWAPVAEEVQVLLFEDENKNGVKQFPLEKGIKGTWELKLDRNLEGKYYIFNIMYDNNSYETVDPYAKAVGTNSKLGLIVNMEKTSPEGWKWDQRVELKNPVDAVIYEVHIRDFSVSEESGIKHKGKFLGVTESGTTNSWGFKTGLDHLQELGITHVHFLPIFDFASVDEKNKDDYNWGYDPYFFNVPEGSYASEPADESRIMELKQMIKKLHEHNIGVIMDVVYNHTYYCEKSPFQITAPGYFYRKYQQSFANGSGCGNEFASERLMARKFIIDSVNYWAEEYHIDGFRFDLMGLIDKETMIQVEKSLHKKDSSILIYGEPWFALPPQLKPEQIMSKGNQKGMQIAVFNDDFRDAIKGESRGKSKGFVSGNLEQLTEIKKGVVGGIKYNEKISSFTSNPDEAVNYVSCHDDLSLWDKLAISNSNDSMEVRIKRDRMAQAIILTAQGIPFIYEGEDFLRTKYKEENTYNSGDKINQLKWERKKEFYSTFKYYQGLIKLRKQHPAFRMNDSEMIRKHLKFMHSHSNTLGFKLIDHANQDQWETIVVLYNPGQDWAHFKLPQRQKWGIVVDDEKAGIIDFNTFIADNVNVPPISVMVLHSF